MLKISQSPLKTVAKSANIILMMYSYRHIKYIIYDVSVWLVSLNYCHKICIVDRKYSQWILYKYSKSTTKITFVFKQVKRSTIGEHKK